MKFATKIGVGYAIVIASMFAMLLYQSSVIYQMQSVNRRLSQVSFEAANLSYRLRQTLDPLEEFIRKFFVTRDPGYLQQVQAMQDLFGQDLDRISGLRLHLEESEPISQLSTIWDRYREVSSRPDEIPLRGGNEWLNSQLDHLQLLRSQTEKVIQEVQHSITLQVQEATQAGGRAERVSLGVAAATLGASLFISLMIVRSFSRRLNQVTQGTHAIARGNFAYRLPTSGDDEFSDLAQDFNSMAQRLSELDQMKKDFVSHVSHELKTPLGSIHETIDLLLEEIPGSLTAEQRRLLQLNLQSTQRLSSTIGNVLDMSRIEAGVMEYHLQQCDMIALVRTAVGELELQLNEKDIKLTTEFEQQPVTIVCDEDCILQVVLNLLGNALKFSPQGGEITVRIDVMRQVPDRLSPSLRQKLSSSPKGFALLAVSDRGPGVPDPHKKRIFEKFHQIKQGRQGVGLGLAISRNIVEGHKGVIWVEDHVGGGSLFQALLPIPE